MAQTYSELSATSKKDLIAEYDRTAQSTQIGLSFLRDELARRALEDESATMLKLTVSMRRMTVVITVLTATNVLAVVWDVLKSG